MKYTKFTKSGGSSPVAALQISQIKNNVLDSEDAKIMHSISAKDELNNNWLHRIANIITSKPNVTEASNLVANAVIFCEKKASLKAEENDQGFTPAELLLYSLDSGSEQKDNGIKSQILELYKLLSSKDHRQQICKIDASEDPIPFLKRLSQTYQEIATYIATEANLDIADTVSHTTLTTTSSHSINNSVPSLLENAQQYPLSTTSMYIGLNLPIPIGTTMIEATVAAKFSQQSDSRLNSIVSGKLENIKMDFQNALPKLSINVQKDLLISFIENTDFDKSILDDAFEKGVKKREKRKAIEFDEGNKKLSRTASYEAINPDKHIKLANEHQNARRFSEAIENYQSALRLLEQNPNTDRIEIANLLHTIGINYGLSNDYQNGLHYHMRALDIYKNYLPLYHKIRVDILHNIGCDYDGLNDNQKALDNHLEALEILQKILPQNHKDLLPYINVVAIAYKKIDNQQKALEYQLKCLEMLDKLNLDSLQNDKANILIDTASTHLLLNDPIESKECIKDAREIYLRMQNNEGYRRSNEMLDEIEGNTWRSRVQNVGASEVINISK